MPRIRPICLWLAGWIVGILIAPRLDIPVPALLLLAALPAGGAALWFHHMPPAAVVWLLMAAFVLLGVARTRQTTLPAPDDISRWAGQPSLWVLGVVASDPEPRLRSGWSCLLEATALYDFHAVRPVTGRMRVSLPGDRPPLAGSRLWLRGRVELPPTASGAGLFDYRQYLARRGVFSAMTVRYADDIRSLPTGTSNLFQEAARRVRHAILSVTESHLAPDDALLMNGLLLSVRSQFPVALEEAFRRTGAVHVLSVSGLHMTALAGFLVWLLPRIGLPRKVSHIGAMTVLWLFALASGGSSAALRAATMASLFLVGPLVGRTASSLHSLTVAALILLGLEPGTLFDPGLQLSFLTMGALLLFMPPLLRLWLPWEPGMAWSGRASRYILAALVSGIVAHAGSAPLTAYHFNDFSVIAPVANIPIVAVSEALLIFGLWAVGFTLLAGPVAAPVWVLVSWMLWLLRWLTEAFSRLPFAAFSVPSPSVAGLIAYYLILGGIAIALRGYVRKRAVALPADSDGRATCLPASSAG